MSVKPKGRKRKYSEYEELLNSLPKVMSKRPKYVRGIGVFRGARGETVWIKINLPHGSIYKGKSYKSGSSLEIKLGKLSSWSWEQLEAEHNVYQGKADRGEPFEDKDKVVFKDWADNWLRRAKTRLRSYDTDERQVRLHLLPYFGDMALTTISTPDVNNWVSDRLSTAAPSAVKRGIGTLSAIMSDARRNSHISENPCKDADRIRGIVGRQRFLSMEELISLLSAAEQVAEWLPDFIVWGVHSGMRKSEILKINWVDISKLSDGRTIVLIPTSKADQPRMLVCTDAMSRVLLKQGDRKQPNNNTVFPVTRMTLRRKWEKARALVDLQDVTMHDLRRTHSTHAAAAGVDLRTLADRIGHTDLTMLQKHYAAIVGAAAIEAVEKIDKVFAGVQK